MQELAVPTALKLGQQQPRPLDIYGPGHPGAANAWYGCGHVNSDLLGLTSHDKGEECIGGLRLQPLLDPVHACHHSLMAHQACLLAIAAARRARLAEQSCPTPCEHGTDLQELCAVGEVGPR